MNPVNLVKLRLAAQRISATTFARPSEVVAWLGAVQAQDYLGAMWAVGLRMAKACQQDVERALADRTIVRTWPMRGTLHFVAAADARWMVELLGPKVVARATGRFRALNLDGATIAHARRVLFKSLAGGRSLPRAAIYDALERAKISVAGQRGIHIIWRLAHECVLCFGPREGKQQTFVLFEEWLPAAKGLARDEALAEIACRYFTSHGPATAADFAWWSGQNLTDARHAVHLAGRRLDEETVGGRMHWFAPSAAPLPRVPARAYLLPAFDEFLVGYANRSAAVERADMIHVNAGGGLLKPTIVVDGHVVGTWKRRLARGEVIVSPTLFVELREPQTHAVALAVRRYTDFLGIGARATL